MVVIQKTQFQNLKMGKIRVRTEEEKGAKRKCISFVKLRKEILEREDKLISFCEEKLKNLELKLKIHDVEHDQHIMDNKDVYDKGKIIWVKIENISAEIEKTKINLKFFKIGRKLNL
jgi:hypothetical protein